MGSADKLLLNISLRFLLLIKKKKKKNDNNKNKIGKQKKPK